MLVGDSHMFMSQVLDRYCLGSRRQPRGLRVSHAVGPTQELIHTAFPFLRHIMQICRALHRGARTAWRCGGLWKRRPHSGRRWTAPRPRGWRPGSGGHSAMPSQMLKH